MWVCEKCMLNFKTLFDFIKYFKKKENRSGIKIFIHPSIIFKYIFFLHASGSLFRGWNNFKDHLWINSDFLVTACMCVMCVCVSCDIKILNFRNFCIVNIYPIIHSSINDPFIVFFCDIILLKGFLRVGIFIFKLRQIWSLKKG